MDLNQNLTGALSAGTFAQGGRRATGLGLVIGIHVLAVIGISAAYIRPVPTPKPSTELRPNLPIEKQPEPEARILIDRPKLPDVRTAPVDIPQVPDSTPTANRLTSTTSTDVTDSVGREGQDWGGGTAVQPPVKNDPITQIRNPGAICLSMPKPEVPVLAWSGDAIVHAVATVRSGRVVGTELSMAGAALDARSKRALKQAVEAALAGYHCPGDHQFQQDFAFRLD